MKHDLMDMTFLIPVRTDSMYRLENLLLTVHFLSRNFKTNIKILEADRYCNNLIKELLPQVEYTFIEDRDLVFHRTKYQNLLVQNVTTPYIAIWEAEIIIPPSQVLDAISQLRNDSTDVSFPYDGKALDTTFLLREYYAKAPSVDLLNRNKNKMTVLYDREDLVGGALFIKRDMYIQSGMDDERYYGWGNEDFERVLRWKILKYRIYRATGCLYHLSHSRGDNSRYISRYSKDKSLGMMCSLNFSSKQEIENSLLVSKKL